MKNKKEIFDFSLLNRSGQNLPYSSFTKNYKTIDQLNDFSVPVNSYFPPARVMKSLYNLMPHALHYYPESNYKISEYIAMFSNIGRVETVVAGNGAAEIISWLNAIFIKQSLFVSIPTFGRWIDEPAGLGIKVHTKQYRDESDYRISKQQFVNAVRKSRARNAVICNPNNPTGSLFSRAEMLWILGNLSHLDNVIVDESFIDFASLEPPSIKNDVDKFRNVWVVKSFANNLGLHGMRIGFAVSNPTNIARMRKYLPCWNINGIVEMLLSLLKTEQEAYQVSRMKIISDTQYLASRLAKLRVFQVSPSASNFVYVRLSGAFDGIVLRDRLLKNHACLIRNCDSILGATKQHFRIATRPRGHVDTLISVLKQELTIMKSNATSGRLELEGESNGAGGGIPVLTTKVPVSPKIPLPRGHIYKKQ